VHLVADIRNKYNATRILKAVMARVTGWFIKPDDVTQFFKRWREEHDIEKKRQQKKNEYPVELTAPHDGTSDLRQEGVGITRKIMTKVATESYRAVCF